MTSYDILFEPVRIGPKIARNRFYQVPHCCGMGHLRPRAHAAMRGIKAEGGWAVVSTEETEIHPTSDIAPASEQRLWDARDIPALRLMTDAVHAHGALAAVELVHNGFHSANLFTRIAPLAPVHMIVDGDDPVQARGMSLRDIRDFRRWHRDAVLRARDAGFDVIYVYAGHNMTLTQHFLLPRYNTRSDAYGGSLENRIRLTRELIEDAKDAVGHDCAIAFRFAVDELLGEEGLSSAGEARDVVGMLAELPDLWDVNVSGWANDSQTYRFAPNEGYQEPYTAFVKSLTTKPVVGVGRFTSPDAMVSQIRRGVMDLIGAARPSIADPFLPEKIRSGRIDEIRECIGCNVCVTGDNRCVPIRCTQNPTMGEEWRRGWHPERIEPKRDEGTCLVVGAGPAGLECALQLARRGYHVTLAEAGDELGGRARREARLPGLGSYARVADWRERQLRQMANVDIYLGSHLDAVQVLELGADHVFIATGSRWRADGIGRTRRRPLDGLPDDRVHKPSDATAGQPHGGLGLNRVYTPDDIMAGRLPVGRVLVYDDDYAYLGGVLAERLVQAGCQVHYATPAAMVSQWLVNSLEQGRAHCRLAELGVAIHLNRRLEALADGGVVLACSYTGVSESLEMDAVVLVTERQPDETLLLALGDTAGARSVRAIGDCHAPGLIAAAVYAGHQAARELGASEAQIEAGLFRRELPSLED